MSVKLDPIARHKARPDCIVGPGYVYECVLNVDGVTYGAQVYINEELEVGVRFLATVKAPIDCPAPYYTLQATADNLGARVAFKGGYREFIGKPKGAASKIIRDVNTNWAEQPKQMRDARSKTIDHIRHLTGGSIEHVTDADRFIRRNTPRIVPRSDQPKAGIGQGDTGMIRHEPNNPFAALFSKLHKLNPGT